MSNAFIDSIINSVYNTGNFEVWAQKPCYVMRQADEAARSARKETKTSKSLIVVKSKPAFPVRTTQLKSALGGYQVVTRDEIK